MVVQYVIEAKNLKKHFEDKPILEHASFSIAEGQCVGIYGPSGIGKSTIAKILCGVLKPDAGEVFLDGALLYSADTPYDRKSGLTIQMVYQQPYSALDFNQKIISGFYELIRYHKLAASRQDASSLIAEIMDEVGLDMEILAHLPQQISGGEAQRIAIARCLLLKPRLLILDEATSMLDVSTQANVLAMIRRAVRKNNGSILLISHDRELVDYICDQTYVFDKYNLYLKEKTRDEKKSASLASCAAADADRPYGLR